MYESLTQITEDTTHLEIALYTLLGLVVGVVPYLDAAKWGLLAVTLIGIGVMLWARIDDRRQGLRFPRSGH